MPDLPYRRIVAILGFVLVILFLGWVLYALFFAAPALQNGNALPTGTGPGGGLPTVGPGERPSGGAGGPTGLPPIGTTPTPAGVSPRATGGPTEVTPLVASPTTAPTIGADGQSLVYYQPNDGHFYRIRPDGTASLLSDAKFFNVEQITWSSNRNEAVLEYPDGSNIVYDFQKKSQVTLPKHWQNFSFSPDGNQLAFKSLGVDRDSRWLGVAGIDGANAQALEPLGDNESKVTVDWSPNRQMVGYTREATGLDQQDIFFIGLHQENFRSMSVPGIGFRGQWTPGGDQLLYSVSSSLSDYKPVLWVAGASGDSIGANRHSLGITTWADKCAFASTDNIICAVPQSLPTGSGLAPGVADTIPDNLYQINLSTGIQRLRAIPETPFSASQVVVTNDQQWVVVQDKISGRLYKIRL